MAKLTGTSFKNVKNNGSNGVKAKVDRDTYAIVGEKGLVLCTNGTDIQAYQGDSVVDTALEALLGLLESIPDNTDEIIAKPVRIILPRVIGGIATGSFIDYVRTGKTVTTGEPLSKERLEAYTMVMKAMSTKFANVEILADRHMSKDDREKVVDPAWKALKEEISNIVRGGISGIAQQTSSTPTVSKEDADRIAELKAKLATLEDELLDADTDEEEAKIEKKIGKVQSAIARLLSLCGQAPEETKVVLDAATQALM